MRGRKPIPSAIRAITRQGRKRSKADQAREPQPPAGLGKPPTCLSKAAKKTWKALAPRLEEMSVGTTADREAFAILCESYAAWQALIAAARDQGPIVKINGSPCVNPMLKRSDVEAEKVRRLLVEFGLTPSSRTRMKTEGVKEIDELAEFLKPMPTPRPAPMRIAGTE